MRDLCHEDEDCLLDIVSFFWHMRNCRGNSGRAHHETHQRLVANGDVVDVECVHLSSTPLEDRPTRLEGRSTLRIAFDEVIARHSSKSVFMSSCRFANHSKTSCFVACATSGTVPYSSRYRSDHLLSPGVHCGQIVFQRVLSFHDFLALRSWPSPQTG